MTYSYMEVWLGGVRYVTVPDRARDGKHHWRLATWANTIKLRQIT